MASDTPGDRLRELRLAAGFSKREPAARAIGIAPATMAHHELGLREITDKRAASYGAFFNVPASYILFGGELPASTDPLNDAAQFVASAQSIGMKPGEVARILRAKLPADQIASAAQFILAVGAELRGIARRKSKA